MKPIRVRGGLAETDNLDRECDVKMDEDGVNGKESKEMWRKWREGESELQGKISYFKSVSTTISVQQICTIFIWINFVSFDLKVLVFLDDDPFFPLLLSPFTVQHQGRLCKPRTPLELHSELLPVFWSDTLFWMRLCIYIRVFFHPSVRWFVPPERVYTALFLLQLISSSH